MSAREERLVTENNLWELDAWLDKVDVFAKPHYDYVNNQLVNTGIKFGNNPTRMTAFIGDTIVRHEDGTHTVLSAKDAAELARLRAERHSTNEALSDAAKQLRVQRDRIAELEAECLAVLNTAADMANPAKPEISFFGPHGPTVADWLRMVGRRLAKEQTAPQRQQEDPHDSDLHHDYALGRDLPFIPQQITGRCPKGHTFEDCTCGGGR